MARGFTQYGAREVVGRQAARPVRGPGGARPMGGNAPPTTTPPTTTPPTTPTVPTVPSSGNVAAGWLSAATAGQAPRIIPPSAVEDADAELAAYLVGEDGPPSNAINYSTGSGGGETVAQRLAREAAQRGAQTSAGYLEQQLSGVGAQYAPLLAQIAANRASLEGGVNTNYQTALAALAARVGAANTETTANYDALRARLEAAAPRAYSDLPVAQAPTLSQDAVSRYAQAIGAPTGAIGQAAVEAAAPYAGTADAYNRLINTLRANEAAGQASRLAGVDMGRTSTASRIAAQNLASTNALDVQKNTALAQILQAIQGQELGISQQQLAQENALRQALAGIYGTGYVTAPPRNAAGGIDFSGVDFDALGRLMRGR